MEKDFFKCYKLFYDIGKELPVELKAKYYDALMEYGLYGTEPTDAVIKSLLQGPIFSINKSNELREKNSRGGKNHFGNQYTKGDTKWKAQKTPVEVSGSTMEVSGSVMEDNGRKKKKEIERININKNNNTRFEEFWKEYPLKKGKPKAMTRYEQAVSKGVSEDLLIQKAKEYAEECKIKNTEQQYIKRAEGWLNSGRYEDDYITAKPKQVKSEDKPYDFTQKPTLIRPKLPGITNLKKEY